MPRPRYNQNGRAMAEAKRKTPAGERPVHERIANDLRRAILSGEYPPGSRLPTTGDLKKTFDASSATVQKALGLLKSEGIAEGRPGSSVIVLEHRRRTLRPDGRSTRQPSAKADAKPMHARSRLLKVEEIKPPAEIAAALGLEEGATVVARSTVLTLNDEPCELITSYFPASLARDTPLAGRRSIRDGERALLTELGHPVLRTVDRISAEEPTQEEYAALALPAFLPVLRTVRTVYSTNDHPVVATIMAKAGNLYQLEYEF